MATYVNGIQGKKIFADRAENTKKGVNIDDKLEALEDAIGAIGAFEVVGLNAQGLPDVDSPKTKVIYLTKEASSTKTDPYTEWIYTGSDFEVIGETSIDLSGYALKSSLKPVATSGSYNDLTNLPDLTLKADKSEMTITAVTGDSTKKTIQLKSGTSQQVVVAHQDISGKQDVISDLATIRSGAAAGATAVQPEDLTEATASDDGLMSAEDKEKLDSIDPNEIGKPAILPYGCTISEVATAKNAGKSVIITRTSGGDTLYYEFVGFGYGTYYFSTILKDGQISLISLSPDGGNGAWAGVTGNIYKTIQAAVSDPTASGDSITFIDTISQDTNGVISVTKKNVRNATDTASGLMSSTDKEKLDNIEIIGSSYPDGNAPLRFIAGEDMGYGRRSGFIALGSDTENGRMYIGTTETGQLVLAKQDNDYVTEIEGVALKSDIPAEQVNSDWNATSGVAQILNKPTSISTAEIEGLFI